MLCNASGTPLQSPTPLHAHECCNMECARAQESIRLEKQMETEKEYILGGVAEIIML